MHLSSSSSWLAGVVLMCCLGACGGAKKDVYVEKPVDDLYNKAMDEIVEERYATAAKTFDEVESQHPYSVWATKGQIMAAYAQYEAGNYGEAIIAADRFIQLHTGHRDIAYAYYLKAISYYVQITDVGRDQKITEQAVKALDDVVRRFPDSKYARDAKLKLDFTRDHLAGKEMEIGRYYLNRGQYLAAMNRLNALSIITRRQPMCRKRWSGLSNVTWHSVSPTKPRPMLLSSAIIIRAASGMRTPTRSSPGPTVQVWPIRAGLPATSEACSDLLGAVAPDNMKNC